MSLSSESGTLRALGRFAADFRDRDLPADVWHAAERCLVDWTAATIAGGARPPATLLAAALADDIDRGPAVLLPSGRRAGVRTAALVNGCAAHTVEVDDIYRDALFHPGAPAISAALAIAQDRRATGERLLRAIVAGYELSTRIGVVVQPAHYNFWHATGTLGTFGAAAAASVGIGLDDDGCVHALATAGTLAAGLQQAFRSHSMSKPLHAGRAAETGLLAALGAEQGVTGALDILEGPRGFGAAMSNRPDFARTLDRPDTFNIPDTTFKAYAACGHTFAAIDAALAIRAHHPLVPAAVSRIHIATYAKALEVAGRIDPQTPFEARFSLAYCVAVIVATGSARLDAFSDERVHDPVLRSLVGKTVVAVEPKADALYPRQRMATVTIHTTDGAAFTATAPTRKGDPDNPLTDAELGDKFLELAAPIVGRAAAAGLLAALWRVRTVGDVAALPLPAAPGEVAMRSAR
jgi:2-methylcitrate dehydratase PrpD